MQSGAKVGQSDRCAVALHKLVLRVVQDGESARFGVRFRKLWFGDDDLLAWIALLEQAMNIAIAADASVVQRDFLDDGLAGAAVPSVHGDGRHLGGGRSSWA